jgi:hypothetical protein
MRRQLYREPADTPGSTGDQHPLALKLTAGP